MFGSQILEVGIGLILTYLVLSLLCSAFREILEGYLKTRAAFLERGIRELLHDPKGTTLTAAVYNHPQLYGLFRGIYDPNRIRKNGTMPIRSNLPSYIPARNFALAMLDIVVRGTDTDDPQAAHPSTPTISPQSIRERVTALQNPPVQRAILTALESAAGDLEKVRKNLETWFDSSMDRVSGWYKRRTQVILLGLGLSLAVAMNANSIAIARHLYQDRTLRESLVSQATARTEAGLPQQVDLESQLAELDRLDLPLGWTDTTFGLPGHTRTVEKRDSGGSGPVTSRKVTLRWWDHFLSPLFGWILTGLAITLGAPFWFDLLNKFMVIRATVKPHEKSPEEASEDRQPPSKDRQPSQPAEPEPESRPEPSTATGTTRVEPEPKTEPVATATVAEGTPDFTPQKWASGDSDEEGDL
jgi:hypothetical protein